MSSNPGWGTPPPPPGSHPGQWSGGAPREHPDGTTVLVLGILSLVVCGILGPFAWFKGNKVLREIDANPSAYTNRGSVSAGRICGIISSVLLMVVAAFVALVIVVAVVGSTTS